VTQSANFRGRPRSKGATTGGRGVRTPLQIWTDHPNFFDEECDYSYVTDCSPRKWVCHPYFVLYNNLDQGIGPPNFENVVAPLPRSANKAINMQPYQTRRGWTANGLVTGHCMSQSPQPICVVSSVRTTADVTPLRA